jgi:hypothetical protein
MQHSVVDWSRATCVTVATPRRGGGGQRGGSWCSLKLVATSIRDMPNYLVSNPEGVIRCVICRKEHACREMCTYRKLAWTQLPAPACIRDSRESGTNCVYCLSIPVVSVLEVIGVAG